MGSRRTQYKLSDIIEIIGGGTPKRSIDEYWCGHIPWLSVVDFNSDYRFVSSSIEKITELGLNKSSTKLLPKGSLIISARGTVGCLAQLNFPMAFNQSCYGLIAKRDVLENDYLYYLVKHKVTDLKQKVHGSVFDTITRDTFEQIIVDIPNDAIEREGISKTLGDLDKKIELNQQTNQTLEKMAQTLFKSWFVDFDPVFDNLLVKADFKLENLGSDFPEALLKRAQKRLLALDDKAKIALLSANLYSEIKSPEETSSEKAPQTNIHQHFPSEFEHNEQFGWIPKGWAASKLKEFGKVITGKTPPKKIDDAFDIEGIPFITPTDVDGDVFTLNVARHLTENGLGAVKNNIVEAGSVCVTCIGSQMGKTIIAPDKSVTNQQLNSIVLSEKYFRNYIFMNLRTRREELFNLGSSGSTMPILNKSSFENLSVLKPNESGLKAFSDITERYLAKILLNSQQNEKLTAIRDTLLPKLISGELRTS
jgi:type I restriction enzyme S subunit